MVAVTASGAESVRYTEAHELVGICCVGGPPVLADDCLHVPLHRVHDLPTNSLGSASTTLAREIHQSLSVETQSYYCNEALNGLCFEPLAGEPRTYWTQKQ
jgi:hypothetical protein